MVKGEYYAVRWPKHPQTTEDYAKEGVTRAKAIVALPWLERAPVLQRLASICPLTHKATLRALVDIDLMSKLTGVAV